jgi:hypothetical protein
MRTTRKAAANAVAAKKAVPLRIILDGMLPPPLLSSLAAVFLPLLPLRRDRGARKF